MDIAIAGIGGFCDGIEKCIKRNVNILYYIDNDISKRRCGRAGKNVCSYYECSSQTVDYVVVALSLIQYWLMIWQERDIGYWILGIWI